MNTSRLIIAAAMLALAGAAAHSADKTEKTEKNEARLAKLIEGRTPGEPVTCIPLFKSNLLEVIDGVALVYDVGDTVYVARPVDPKTLGRDDIVVIERFGGQLCYNDIIRTVDRAGGYLTGVVFLNKFVPYKKQK
jgi:hypothetical protein